MQLFLSGFSQLLLYVTLIQVIYMQISLIMSKILQKIWFSCTRIKTKYKVLVEVLKKLMGEAKP